MVAHQSCNQLVRVCAARNRMLNCVIAIVAAHVGFFIRIQLSIGQESVLKIIDSDLHRFCVAHRTQMPRNFQAAFVCLFNCGAHFLTRDMRVGLKRSHSMVGPKSHNLPCIFRPGELIHLQVLVAAGALQIGTCNIQMRARNCASLNRMLEPHIANRIAAARCACRRHTVCQIEPGR